MVGKNKSFITKLLLCRGQVRHSILQTQIFLHEAKQQKRLKISNLVALEMAGYGSQGGRQTVMALTGKSDPKPSFKTQTCG